MHEHEQVLRNDVMSFVTSLFRDSGERVLAKAHITGELRKHELPKDVGFLFGRLPEGVYTQPELVGALGDLVENDEIFGGPWESPLPRTGDTLDEAAENY